MVGIIAPNSEDLRLMAMDDTITKLKNTRSKRDSDPISQKKKKRKMYSNAISPEKKKKKLKKDSHDISPEKIKKMINSPKHDSDKVGSSNSHLELIQTSDKEVIIIKNNVKKVKKMKKKLESSSKVFPTDRSSSSEEEKESLLAWVEMSLKGDEQESVEDHESKCEHIPKRSKKERKQSNDGNLVLDKCRKQLNAFEKAVGFDADKAKNSKKEGKQSSDEKLVLVKCSEKMSTSENIVVAGHDKATSLSNSCGDDDDASCDDQTMSLPCTGHHRANTQSSIEIVNGANGDHRKIYNSQSSAEFVNGAKRDDNKRKREDEKARQYVMKRSLVIRPLQSKRSSSSSRTSKVLITAWDRTISVTVTSEASVIQEWISAQSGDIFGLDVEWKPNRNKSERNKVSLLQLCSENECLIVQMLFLDSKPPALVKLLSDPSKRLAGVGVLADCKRLQNDHGLTCGGEIELTTLAVEQLKRGELRHVGLKVLVNEVLGVKMQKPKRVTLSNWARQTLEFAQVEYACLDAWVSFAVCQKLLSLS